MWVGVGKLIQQGTRGNPQSSNAVLQGTSGCQYGQTSCCVEEEFHTKMRDLKRENLLNPVLLIIITFISFIHEMYEDMPCMHRILHVGNSIENYTCIMNH